MLSDLAIVGFGSKQAHHSASPTEFCKFGNDHDKWSRIVVYSGD